MEISKWNHKALYLEEIKEDKVDREVKVAREAKVVQAKVQKTMMITCLTDVSHYLSLILLSAV
jgi:hypothetical protein